MSRSRRRIPRLYIAGEATHRDILLGDRESHYLTTVLRLKPGDEVTVFDGEGSERRTVIESLRRRAVALRAIEDLAPLPESPLDFTLAPAIVKSDAMDSIVQKATELGVTRILPVTTEYSVVRLDPSRAQRKRAHWQKVAQSACEQCGRHRPPVIAAPLPLSDCLNTLTQADVSFVLDPTGDTNSGSLPESARSVVTLVGPEGGFSRTDLEIIEAAGCARIRFGKRILRADTAALLACAYVQHRWGDLG